MSANNLPLLRKHSDVVTTGICYIGSYNSNFHIIVRCPVHVYVVIKKAFDLYGVECSFYSGNIPVSDLALPQFLGTFIYRNKDKIRKYNAALIYPLDLNTCVDDDLPYINKVLDCFKSFKYEFFDKKDRSAKTLFQMFVSDFISNYESISESIESTI